MVQDKTGALIKFVLLRLSWTVRIKLLTTLEGVTTLVLVPVRVIVAPPSSLRAGLPSMSLSRLFILKQL